MCVCIYGYICIYYIYFLLILSGSLLCLRWQGHAAAPSHLAHLLLSLFPSFFCSWFWGWSLCCVLLTRQPLYWLELFLFSLSFRTALFRSWCIYIGCVSCKSSCRMGHQALDMPRMVPALYYMPRRSCICGKTLPWSICSCSPGGAGWPALAIQQTTEEELVHTELSFLITVPR